MDFQFHRSDHLVWLKTSPSDHVISKTLNKTVYVASYILLYSSFAEEPETGREFELELLHFDTLFTNKFTFNIFCLNKIYGKSWCTSVQTFNGATWENSWLVLMKNTINTSSNVNLILKLIDVLFFRTVTENLRCCSTASTMPQSQDRFWNLQGSKLVNHNGAKMNYVWNVNKLIEALTKTEVGKLRTRAAQWLSRCHQTK